MMIGFNYILLLFSAFGGTDLPKIPIVLAEDNSSLHLVFAGDIMMHGPQIKAAHDPATDTYDFHRSFKFIKPIIERADLAIGNLELTLPGRPPYSGWPNFKSPDTLITALADTGFDVLTTANNHSNDAGLNGVLHTIDVIRNKGIYQTGTFKNAADRALHYPLVVYKKGFKLAFLNYTYGTDNKKHRPPSIVNLIDPARMESDLHAAKQLNADAIIVLMHWGKEYKLLPAREEKKLAKKILEWGGDLVIGAHPHVVQSIEVLETNFPEEGNRQKLIAYSLGNFISNQQQKNTDGSILLEVTLEKNKSSETVLGEVHYVPIWRYINKENRRSEFYCIPIAPYKNNTYRLPDFRYKTRAAMIEVDDFLRKHLEENSDCPEKRYLLNHKKNNSGMFLLE